jgi:hypothetical protein
MMRVILDRHDQIIWACPCGSEYRRCICHVTIGDTRTPEQVGVHERLYLAARVIYSFGDAAFRWREAPLDVGRFAAEVRMNTLAGVLVNLLFLETDEIDPVRVAQDVYNAAKSTCTPFSPERIAARLSRTVATVYDLDRELESAA